MNRIPKVFLAFRIAFEWELPLYSLKGGVLQAAMRTVCAGNKINNKCPQYCKFIEEYHFG